MFVARVIGRAFGTTPPDHLPRAFTNEIGGDSHDWPIEREGALLGEDREERLHAVAREGALHALERGAHERRPRLDEPPRRARITSPIAARPEKSTWSTLVV